MKRPDDFALDPRQLPAELAAALGDINLNETERVKELDRLQDLIVKHQKRYQKMVGHEG